MYYFVEKKLEEAPRKGAFDNRPDAGRTIKIFEIPYIPVEWRLATKLLKDYRVLRGVVGRR